MASSKKISDLFRLTQLSDDDEFVVVDKSTTGQALETGLGGRTTKVTFKDLKESVGTSDPQGQSDSGLLRWEKRDSLAKDVEYRVMQ